MAPPNNTGTAADTTLINRLVTKNGPVFISAAQLYLDLTDASDHLPVVADYTIPIPAPRISCFSLAGTNLVLTVTNGITNAVYTVLMTTNIALPLTNWVAVATNVPGTGSFTFTATNIVNRTAAPKRFYILQEK